MPLMNKNYVTPAWIDNAAPPINDDELNAMSETLEGSQILVGSGAPTSSTPGKVGQRYADISTTPATMYRVESVTPSAIPQKAYTDAGGLLIGYRKNNGTIVSEIRVSSSLDKEVFLFLQSASNTVITLYAFCRTSNARVREEDSSQTISWTLNTRTQDRDWYYGVGTISWSESQEYETTMLIPEYPTFSDMLDVLNNPPVPTWKPEADPNRNTARPYSTGGSYAAGDFCIQEGKLWKALDATSGAWDGSKWEQAKYADDLSGHKDNQDNPHNVTAAQTGAISPTVLATVQATTTAARDYYAGEYFFYEGQLYELKEAVQQGGDLLEDEKSMPAALGDGIAELGAKTGSIALSAVWTGEDPYSQTATLTGATVTGKSKIDLTPTAAQLSQLAEDGVISLLIENNGGTLTAWAVGAQPSAAMTIACTVTETV